MMKHKLSSYFVLKRDLLKIFILILIVLSAMNVCLYIKSTPRYVKTCEQRLSTAPTRNTFISNTEDKFVTALDKNGTAFSNTVNININVNVHLHDKSEVVSTSLKQLETAPDRSKSNVDEIQDHDGSSVTISDTNKNDNFDKQFPKLKYLLTLFSTWRNTNETKHIHRNTLRNWASFKPSINVVIFTDDRNVANEAKTFGCNVLRIPKTANNGLPILRHMFFEAKAFSDSYFYGFANSDILFNDGLLSTLLTLTYKMRDMFILNPILVTGNRWNVPNIIENEILRRKNIEGIIESRGSFFMTSAEEYFITSYNYPWWDIPDLAIGVVAYDNWLVMNARMKGHFTVDTTKTILALHQDMDKHYYRSHFRNESSYNENLLRNLNQTDIPYHKGYANCIEEYTDFLNDSVVIKERNVEKYCNTRN